MAPNIIKSPFAAPFLPTISVWDYTFPSGPGISPLTSYPDSQVAFIDGLSGRSLTRGEVQDAALRLKGGMNAMGVKKGDTAAIFGSNSIEWALAAWGCLAAGVIVSPASSAFGTSELTYQLNDSNATVLFISPDLLPVFEKSRSELKYSWPRERVIVLSPPGTSNPSYPTFWQALGPRSEAEAFNGTDAHSTAWLCYSSGTTGLPKGVMTTHHNLTTQFETTRCVRPLPKHGLDVILGFLPFSHMYGLFAVVTTPVAAGVPTVILPKYEEIAVLEAIQKYKVTKMSAVPAVVLGLVHSPNVPRYDVSSVYEIRCGAAPMGPELAAQFRARFPKCNISQGYGMTEASPAITLPLPEDDRAGRKGVGRLVPTYEARLVKENGEEAAPGERGEIWIRGPNVMKGYHGKPEANEKSFAPGHWFKTGDVLYQDEEGVFYVVDRLKELIKYKGFQVPPAEMEALLLSHPSIVDAGVVGVWDEGMATELPRAYVVREKGKNDSEDDVKQWVANRVAQYKRLRGGVVFLDVIPRGPTGKIARNVLREMAKGEYAQPKASANL